MVSNSTVDLWSLEEARSELSKEVKRAIRDRNDKGERDSSKLAEEFGVGTKQVAGLMAWQLNPGSLA